MFTTWDTWNWVRFLLTVAIGILLSVRYLEPLFTRWRKESGVPVHPPVVKQGKLNLGGPNVLVHFEIRVAVFLFIVIGQELLTSMIKADPLLFVISLLGGLLVPGVITYYWMYGATLHTPQAVTLGALGGATSGGLFASAFLLLHYGSLCVLLSPQDCGNLFQSKLIVDKVVFNTVRFIGLNALFFALIGFIGGWTIDKGWGAHPALKAFTSKVSKPFSSFSTNPRYVSLSIAAVILATTLVVDIAIKIFVLLPLPEWFMSILLPDLMRSAGWGLGLLLYAPSNMAFDIRQSD